MRTQYRVLEWNLKSGGRITTAKYQHAHVMDTDIYSEQKMNLSGTYRFYFRYKDRYASYKYDAYFEISL